jgi:hypothetical protein
MRDINCGEVEVTWRQACYNRSPTRDFAELLVKHGADRGNQLFFKDPQIPYVRPLANHDDHIHVCFKPSNGIVKQSATTQKWIRRFAQSFANSKRQSFGDNLKSLAGLQSQLKSADRRVFKTTGQILTL